MGVRPYAWLVCVKGVIIIVPPIFFKGGGQIAMPMPAIGLLTDH